MILAALGLAWIALDWFVNQGWTGRYSHAFIGISNLRCYWPGLAVLCMGPQGQMIGSYLGRVVSAACLLSFF